MVRRIGFKSIDATPATGEQIAAAASVTDALQSRRAQQAQALRDGIASTAPPASAFQPPIAASFLQQATAAQHRPAPRLKEVDQPTYAVAAKALNRRVEVQLNHTEALIKQKKSLVKAAANLGKKGQAASKKLQAELAILEATCQGLQPVIDMSVNHYATKPYRQVVASDQDRVTVGLLCVRDAPDPHRPPISQTVHGVSDRKERVLEIESICAHPEAPGTGTALVVRAVNMAQKECGGRLRLQNQSHGSKFYAKLGFAVVSDSSRNDGVTTLEAAHGSNDYGLNRTMRLDPSDAPGWHFDGALWCFAKPEPQE